jgi:DNA-binding transcriptional MerR regulator
MDVQWYQVKEVAQMTGITVRTLHHYDDIGLLTPSERSRSGYRLYSADDLRRLQQVLIHRELGLPLETIARILADPGFDRRAALMEQREALRRRQATTTELIRSIDAALAEIEGQPMSPQDLFDGFDPAAHQEEAQQRWGHTDAYRKSARRTRHYSPADWQRIKAEDRSLMERMSKLMDQEVVADATSAMDLAEGHRLHIDRWFYPCDHCHHAGLADMYVADPKFTATFEKHHSGLTLFLADAIRANAARQA